MTNDKIVSNSTSEIKLTPAQRKLLASLPRNLADNPLRGKVSTTAKELARMGLVQTLGMLSHQRTLCATDAGRAALLPADTQAAPAGETATAEALPAVAHKHYPGDEIVYPDVDGGAIAVCRVCQKPAAIKRWRKFYCAEHSVVGTFYDDDAGGNGNHSTYAEHPEDYEPADTQDAHGTTAAANDVTVYISDEMWPDVERPATERKPAADGDTTAGVVDTATDSKPQMVSANQLKTRDHVRLYWPGRKVEDLTVDKVLPNIIHFTDGTTWTRGPIALLDGVSDDSPIFELIDDNIPTAGAQPSGAAEPDALASDETVEQFNRILEYARKSRDEWIAANAYENERTYTTYGLAAMDVFTFVEYHAAAIRRALTAAAPPEPLRVNNNAVVLDGYGMAMKADYAELPTIPDGATVKIVGLNSTASCEVMWIKPNGKSMIAHIPARFLRRVDGGGAA